MTKGIPILPEGRIGMPEVKEFQSCPIEGYWTDIPIKSKNLAELRCQTEFLKNVLKTCQNVTFESSCAKISLSKQKY